MYHSLGSAWLIPSRALPRHSTNSTHRPQRKSTFPITLTLIKSHYTLTSFDCGPPTRSLGSPGGLQAAVLNKHLLGGSPSPLPSESCCLPTASCFWARSSSTTCWPLNTRARVFNAPHERALPDPPAAFTLAFGAGALPKAPPALFVCVPPPVPPRLILICLVVAENLPNVGDGNSKSRTI
jgi:hypothetical protein